MLRPSKFYASRYGNLKSLSFLLRLQPIEPLNFQATERATFNSLVRSTSTGICEFILQLQKQAAQCNFGDKPEEHLRDQLIAGVNDTDLQRRLLVKQDVTFQEARDVCQRKDDVNAVTTESNVILFQKTKTHTPTRSQPVNTFPRFPHVPVINPSPKKVNRCFSCPRLLRTLSYAWNNQNTFRRQHCQSLVSQVLDFTHYFCIENYCSSHNCSTTQTLICMGCPSNMFFLYVTVTVS
ncbi:hypothetical protein EG68_12130 [Paragonimus skrjabini miyazakii]|uniref:Uncharacterized protein n=1 Tax=Paragonimus skrjabini miyazakii TaxID=59628 RepID=A0A8S9YIF4_9TREM|nr:hypothetical protein EG68_12130 [Paragonimus skrjabini miyazakii]